jgi:hypothetical protein
MGARFIGCDRDQVFLMPPSLRDWVPEGHLVWTVLDAVAEAPRRNRGIRRVAPGIVVTVDAHGADGQPLRDPILRAWRRLAPETQAADGAPGSRCVRSPLVREPSQRLSATR